MSFRESVIIPYALFKKCQFNTPPPLPVAEPLPPLPPTPDLDEPPAAPNIETPPPPPPPPPPIETDEEEEQKPKWPKKEEKEDIITKMARVVPEEDRPIVERILEQVRAHPNVLGWTDNFEVTVNGIVYPKSNIMEILKFIMKKQIVDNQNDAPFGAKDFVDNLINIIKIPKAWIKTSFIRTSKRKRGGLNLEDEEDSGGLTVSQPKKRTRSQIGHGIFPWISY